ncbi:hypothetical protein CLLU_36090 [Clostridium luticellarii]|uniref:Uncharacterized protein n=1 Tax=Clostridium luticellarii TaxID=1691940 RepID=A0A2T0B464_9CLOT|nr:hypothetical protein CLLU_36090 [Clostridium luticellarii]
MASLVASFTSWRKPFEIVSIIGFLLIILYFFIKEPAVGESEPELQKLIKEGIAMFIVPMNGLKLPQNNDPLMILMTLLKGIVTNPWICMIFTLSFFASALQSANTPNWLALIIDI